MLQEILARRKQITILLVLIALVVAAITFVSKYAIVIVTISPATSGKTTVYASSDSYIREVGTGGILVVERSAKSLIVSSGFMKTQTKIDLPWYGLLTTSVNLKADKNADKVAYNSTTAASCATYSSNLDKLRYYTCQKPRALLEYATPATGPWVSQKVADMSFSTQQASPYMGGALGVVYIANSDAHFPGELAAITETGQTAYYNAPQEIDLSTINRAQIITDTTDPTNGYFAIIAPNGDVYLGSPSGDGKTISYKQLKAPADYNPTYNQTICAVDGDSASCYRGLSTSIDLPDAFDGSKVTSDQIVTASFTNDTSTTTKIAPSEGRLSLTNIYITKDGQLYGTSFKTLYQLNKTSDAYASIELSQNVDSAAGGQAMYFIQDKGVFKVDPATATSYQVFYSPNIQPTALYTPSDKVYVIGTPTNAPQTTSAYLLNTEDDTRPGKRPIDLLPVSPLAFPDVMTMDIVGNKMYVLLKVNFRQDPKQVRQEFENKKETVINSLQSLGIDANTNTTIFTY